MLKHLVSIAFLVAFTVSCTPANQSGPLPTTPPTISLTATSTLISAPTVTAQFTPTPITLQTPSTPGEEPLLAFFISEQGKFQAWLPVSGNIMEYTITRTLFGKSTECPVIVSRLNSAGVTIQYCDLIPEDIASRSNKAILSEVRDVIKKDYRWKIHKEQIGVIEIPYPEGTLSGVEDSGGNVGTFKARIILAGDRVYFVHMYVYSIDWCYCRHQMDYVVDSFYVDPYMSIPFEPTPTP